MGRQRCVISVDGLCQNGVIECAIVQRDAPNILVVRFQSKSRSLKQHLQNEKEHVGLEAEKQLGKYPDRAQELDVTMRGYSQHISNSCTPLWALENSTDSGEALPRARRRVS